VRVGLGFRAELAADLVAQPRVVDFVEVVAETCYTRATARREAIALAERWPVERVRASRPRRVDALADARC